MLFSWFELQDSAGDGFLVLESCVWLFGAASLLFLLYWDLPLLLDVSTCALRLFHKHVEVSNLSLATISSASFNRSCNSSCSFQLALAFLLPVMKHQARALSQKPSVRTKSPCKCAFTFDGDKQNANRHCSANLLVGWCLELRQWTSRTRFSTQADPLQANHKRKRR